MRNFSKNIKLVMDWKAAFWAGIAAGIVFYLLNIFIVPLILGGNMWVIIRLFASLGYGESVLAPPSTFDSGALAVSIIINLILSIGFTFLIAFVFHKWGLLTGIIGGAFFGLGIYAVNFYSLSYFFPWFFALSSWPFVITHILFGAIAGGVYELLEVEKYENVA
ncbi:MAG: hypothetical protein OQJ81_04340 [Melioribacteraceae bacterium]|nr:hypothetical protein [Melioribacteraceae bacterium]